jgi:hypothetical protein
LLIENLDGRPISIAQSVTEVHDYTSRLRDLIHEIEDREDSEKYLLYFFGASGPKRKDAGGLNVRFTVYAASNVFYDEALLERTWADNV